MHPILIQNKKILPVVILRTPRRIEAHVLICFMAYSLTCFAKETLRKSDLGFSFERMREELKEVQASRIRDHKTGQRLLLSSKITDTQKLIYKAFNKKLHRTAQPIPDFSVESVVTP